MDVSAEITIASARDRVASYAMDPRNDPRWIGGISEVERLDEGPLKAGSTVRRVASFLGRRFEYVLQVTELEPGRRIVMRSTKSPFPMVVTYWFGDDPRGTRAGIRIGGDASSLYRVAAPVLGLAVKRSISKDLRTLKGVIEAGASGTAPTR
jgi:uncharacterized membrane protein